MEVLSNFYMGGQKDMEDPVHCLDFQIVTAVIDATASLRHLSLAFCKTSLERILSESLVQVMVRAADLMAIEW